MPRRPIASTTRRARYSRPSARIRKSQPWRAISSTRQLRLHLESGLGHDRFPGLEQLLLGRVGDPKITIERDVDRLGEEHLVARILAHAVGERTLLQDHVGEPGTERLEPRAEPGRTRADDHDVERLRSAALAPRFPREVGRDVLDRDLPLVDGVLDQPAAAQLAHYIEAGDVGLEIVVGLRHHDPIHRRTREELDRPHRAGGGALSVADAELGVHHREPVAHRDRPRLGAGARRSCRSRRRGPRARARAVP